MIRRNSRTNSASTTSAAPQIRKPFILASSVIASNPREVRARLVLGLTEASAGNRAGAIEQFRAIVEIDPTNADGLNNLAYFLTEKSPDEALEFASRALAVAPDNPSVLDTVGWVQYRKGNYREAVAYLKRAFAKDATPMNQFHLGLAYRKVGEMALGSEFIGVAIKKDASLAMSDFNGQVR